MYKLKGQHFIVVKQSLSYQRTNFKRYREADSVHFRKEFPRKSCLDKKTTQTFTAKAWIHLTDVTATHGEVNIKQIAFIQTLVPAETQNMFRFYRAEALLTG